MSLMVAMSARPAGLCRRAKAGAEPRRMENLDLSRAEGMPLLARIVVPLTAVEKEAIGEVRGMSREYCAVPLPPAARVGGRVGRVVRREGRRDLALTRGGGGGGACRD